MTSSHNDVTINRRQFLKLGVCAAVLPGTRLIHPGNSFSLPGSAGNSLVLIQLSGGNDGLNTLVPYRDPNYYSARPTLAIPASAVVPLNGSIGLHPSAQALAALYGEGKLALIQGVGCFASGRSHYRARKNWQTARQPGSGWLWRYIAERKRASSPPCVCFDQTMSKMFESELESATQEAASCGERRYRNSIGTAIVRDSGSSASLPEQLSNIAHLQYASRGRQQILAAISVDGFDTHCHQTAKHAAQLRKVTTAVLQFQRELEGNDCDANILTVIYSEFGRRLQENSDYGTDHGLAGPVFVIGKRVRGGIFGEYGNFDETTGDTKIAFDFRQVYATLLQSWLECDCTKILGEEFSTLGFV